MALCEVADGVPRQLQVLQAVEAGVGEVAGDAVEPTGVGGVVHPASDAVAEGFVDDVAARVHGPDGLVDGLRFTVALVDQDVAGLVAVALLVVVVEDAVVVVGVVVTRRIEGLVRASILVVGGLLVVAGGLANLVLGDVGDGFCHAAEAVVGVQLGVAGVLLGDVGQLAAPVGGGVVVPAGGLFGGAVGTAVDAPNHAAAHVVCEAAGLPFGVGLFDQFAEAVVDVAPVPFVRVVHGDLATQFVVAQGGEVAVDVAGAAEVALGVVAVGDGAPVVVFDFNQFAQSVVGVGFVLPQGVGGDGLVPLVAGGADTTIGGGGFDRPTEEVVVNDVDAGLCAAGGVTLVVRLRLHHGATQVVVASVGEDPAAVEALGGLAGAAAVEALGGLAGAAASKNQ